MLKLLTLVSLSSQYFPVLDKLQRYAANFSYGDKQVALIKQNSFTEIKSVTHFNMLIFIIAVYIFSYFIYCKAIHCVPQTCPELNILPQCHSNGLAEMCV